MMDELKRTFSALDVATIAIGTIIGSGIFLTPGRVLASAGGSVGVAMTVWIIGGVLTLLGALSYIELACMRSGTGGLYVYLRDAFGPVVGFVFGWTMFVVIVSGTVATLAAAVGENLSAFVPMSPVSKRLVALVVIGGLAVINVRGTRSSATFLSIGTAVKVGMLVLLIVVLPFIGNEWSQVEQPWPEAIDGSVVTGGLAAMIGVLWAYEGWQYVTFVAGEVNQPERTFPKGLLLGTVAVILIYVLANVGYIAALGPERLAVSTAVGPDAARAAFGPVGATAVGIAVLFSIISAANGCLLTASRVFFAMSRDGAFFKQLGIIHPKFGTPANSVIALSAWAALLAMTGTFNTLLTYVVFVGWVFYGLGGLSVIVFRRREPNARRPFKVPGYPVTPLLFVASAAAIVINTIVSNPIRGVIGLGGALLGVPVYYLWKRQ